MMSPHFSLENIHRQYLVCRQNKRNTINALRFEYRLEENLAQLQEELEAGTYTPSRSVCFVVDQPKVREIFAADFRDRVVHHILVDAMEKIWEPVFIHDSYACRKGKGTHRAVQRLQSFMRTVSRNGTRRAYFMHLDVQGFFLNINKEVLYQVLARRVRDEVVLWLAGKVIFHDCTKNFVLKGKRDALERIPPHKTLFNRENKSGLPIGNLTSQFFANVYLNELDQFVKHHLKAGCYIRYCDDVVLLHAERERLQSWKDEIRDFLQSRLRLALNDRREVSGPLDNGTDFLGYIVRPDYLLVRRRVVNRLKERLAGYQQKLIRQEMDCTIFQFDPALLEGLRATWSSYRAHLKMAHTYRLITSLLSRFSWLAHIFFQKDGLLTRKDVVPATLQSLKGQYRYFLTVCPHSMVLFQVGRFFELYDGQAEKGMESLGLKRMASTRGFKARCGFPVDLKEQYAGKLTRQGFSVHVVREAEEWLSGIKKRRLTEVRIPASAVLHGEA